MIVKHITRRTVVAAGATGALAGLCAPFVRPARAAAQVIRHRRHRPERDGDHIYLDWMQKNVLKGYGKDYTVDMTFTRGTPEAGTLCAAGQADMATLSFAVFATSVLKSIVPGGMSIVSDNYQDGRPGYAQNTFFVLKDRRSPRPRTSRARRSASTPSAPLSISRCASSSRRTASIRARTSPS